jgi:ketol-acid reductoisomerase
MSKTLLNGDYDSASEAAKQADLIRLLVPDTEHKYVYDTEIAPRMKTGKILGVSHGFSIHYHQIIPPKDIDVIMTAPKAP